MLSISIIDGHTAMIPNLDVDLLKTFLAIADTGNFTRAAEEVHKTQSAVSMQMKRLEELVGRPLFTRDGRQSRFTGDGERLIEYARRIVNLNDEAVAAFTKPELTGTLRFGTPDDYADRFLPEILARFSRTHPLVTVNVDCAMSPVLYERARHGELDLALVTACSEITADEIVRTENLVWVTSQRHSVHMLDTLPVALSHTGCEWRALAIGALERKGRQYRIAYSSPQFQCGQCCGAGRARGRRDTGNMPASRHAPPFREGRLSEAQPIPHRHRAPAGPAQLGRRGVEPPYLGKHFQHAAPADGGGIAAPEKLHDFPSTPGRILIFPM
jgi:DNA-binding transcriptional LysR family regulator